jgi:Raf kinase inhibitor-like YbhB/YbcL family protein
VEQLKFQCSAFDEQGCFRIEYTGCGQDLSPEFTLENLSPAAKTLAVTLEDLSHPIKGFTHWVIWNIPASNRIPAGLPKGKTLGHAAEQGLAYGWHRYAGPKPPKGKTHTYRFTLYALDCTLDLCGNCFKKRFLKEIQGHILQKGEAAGSFRKP